jgi:hypothetical protein
MIVGATPLSAPEVGGFPPPVPVPVPVLVPVVVSDIVGGSGVVTVGFCGGTVVAEVLAMIW